MKKTQHHLKHLLLLLLWTLPLWGSWQQAGLSAQNDGGLWLNADIEKSLNKRFSVEGGAEFRAENNMQRAARWAVSAGLNYRPLKCLKLAAGYAFLDDRNPTEAKERYNSTGKLNGYNIDHSYWRHKHRFYFDVTGRVKAGRFTMSLRERYQLTRFMPTSTLRDRYRGDVSNATGYTGEQYGGFAYEETRTDAKSGKYRHYLRSRVGIDYNIRHCPITPFASYEISNSLTDGFSLDKYRVKAGIDWKIRKKHTISVAYIYENGADDDTENDMHIASIGYKFKL